MRCGTCRFMSLGVAEADSRGEPIVGDPVLICYRFPPIVYHSDGEDKCARPQVAEWDWCGEYQPQEET